MSGGRFRRRRQAGQGRQPHPDGEIELKLARISGLREAIGRQAALIAGMREQIDAAGDVHYQAAQNLRGELAGDGIATYKAQTDVQDARIRDALAAIAGAEAFIAEREEDIARLAAELSPSDLAYLT